MDRQEYQEIIDGIRKGYANGDYERVIMFAREISPKKIRETRILEMVSDAYEYTGKLGLARQTLEVAYERMQGGKQIAYKLAEQSIRLKDIDGAVKYYEDFCRVAPNDTRKYILKYEIATAGGLTIYDRIRILEEYNQKEVDEEALYEMARLYHEAGMGDQCATTVDELTTWFADGDYIKKALELKFAHTPLSPKQQAMYETMMGEYMDPDEFLRQPEDQPPIKDSFDEEAEEFAKRYLNGTLEDTKPIDTEAIEAELAFQQEAQEIAATKKLSLNESVAFATMAANMANEAEVAKAYEIPEPQPEPEKTPLERMVEEPKNEIPEIGGYYTRRDAEVGEGNLNININMEDEYNVDGQMSIDEMFQSYANNIENNSANKAAVEQVEAERLRQIREAVESSIVATPLMDIDDEPETVKIPEQPEPEILEVETEIVEAHIPKTAAETIPGDMTIESMLAAMGETIEDEVKETAPVQEEEPEVVAKATVAGTVAVGIAALTGSKKAREAEENREEKEEQAHRKVKEVREVKEVKKETKYLFDEEPPKEKYVFTNNVEDNAPLDLAVDDIMSELPVADIPEVKEEPKVIPVPVPVPQNTNDLELAMDDIMSELPFDDFVKKEDPEEIAGLEDIGDFLTGDFLEEKPKPEAVVVAGAAVVAAEKLKEEPGLAKAPANTDFEEMSGLDDIGDFLAGEFEVGEVKEPAEKEEEPVKKPQAKRVKEVKMDSEPVDAEAEPEVKAEEKPAEEVKAEPEFTVAPASTEPEEFAELDGLGDFLAGEFVAEAVAEEPAKPAAEEIEKAEPEAEPEVKAEEKPAEEVKAEPELTVAPADTESEEFAELDGLGDFLAGEFVAEAAAEPVVKEEVKEELSELDDIGDFLAGEFVAETEPELETPETAKLEKPELEAAAVAAVAATGTVATAAAGAAVAEEIKEEPELDFDLDSLMAELPVEDTQPIYPYRRYVITEEIQNDMAEFLLVDGMRENIEEAIGNILFIKRNGNINGGNLIVTGDAKSGKTFLAITVVKAVTQELGEGNGRVAKVQSTSINGKNIDKIFQKVEGNDIIIENVGDLDESTLLGILSAMKDGTAKNMVIFEGNVLAIETMINNHPEIEDLFKNRIDISELNISQWADVACDYANDRGYNISDMALLALHAKIDEINMPTKRFGYEDAIKIIDRAIDNARKRNSGKLFATYKKNSSGMMELIESDFDK